ncbi:MAG: hypothetical protein MH472_10970 [Bacteroidia bacterium]|nr:hypothetical protein [Bacteroidia bacterium]
MIKHSKPFLFAIACLLLIVVCLPRFNGNTLLIKQVPYDAKYFGAYVEYFRGEMPQEPIRPMTNSRFLLPLLASFLPFSALTSLNLLNLLCVALSIYFSFKIVEKLGSNQSQKWSIVWMSILSFPCFYYSCIGYVDPSAIACIGAGVWAWLNRNYWMFALCVLLGLMSKETSILLLFFALGNTLQTRKLKAVLGVIIGFGIFLFLHFAIRKFAPLTEGELRFKPLQFSWAAAQNNLYRVNSILSLLLSFGIPGMYLIIHTVKSKNSLAISPQKAGAIVGLLGVLALYLFSFFTTIADGRIIWHGYVFMFMILFENRKLALFADDEKRIERN